MNENMTDVEPGIEERAVNVYQSDAADDFPVLKAFQQYIDAEQTKARKRMMLICIFFSFVLTVVIGVFVGLLLMASSRNQSLNDRLVEYAMKDRERSPVIVQPPKDDSLLLALSNRLDGITKVLAENQARTEKAAAEEAAKAAEADKKRKTAEALEIERLKALLAAEKEKASAEREKNRQAELEAYRRAHYPEFYEKQKPTRKTEEEDADREIESIIKDIKAIDYFDEEEDSDATLRSSKKDCATPSQSDAEVSTDVKDSSGQTWEIPED